MKKYLIGLVLVIALIALGVYLAPSIGDKASATISSTSTVSFQANLSGEYMVFTVTDQAVNFGDITYETIYRQETGGTVCSVTTNAANGYTISVDDQSDTNSCLEHTDTTTYIPDYTGTIATPTAWATDNGFGITMFAADTTKDAKWGTGTTYSDVLNQYAGVPAAVTQAQAEAGYKAGADTTSWAWGLRVANSQKSGQYATNSGSGAIFTFTATTVLS